MAGKKNRKNGSSKPSPQNFTRPDNTSSNSPKNRSKSVDELLAMTKEQLKNECRKRGQKSTGTKNELVQRLGNKMAGGTNRKDATMALNGNNVQNNIKTKNNTDQQRKEKEKKDRESLVLWKRPLTTMEYFCREVSILITTYGKKIITHKKIVTVVVISVLSMYMLMNFKGPHQNAVQGVYKKLLWCLYWIGLGILSSVGLGTGLHTFLLYLGPHIAQVTLAAYECDSLNFPEPPYPDDIICPNGREPGSITILRIMSKVRLEAMCWGAGTALGELPRILWPELHDCRGKLEPDEDDDLKELEELERKKNSTDELTLIERGKLFVEEIVEKVGFFGILACASIPNPLFDLAGITCGHFLVPFWTFFGATLIGKAIIKMHIQKLFVIIAFNENLIETAIEWLTVIPVIGKMLQAPFKAFLTGQKLKLHKKAGPQAPEVSGNILSGIFEKFVIAMILYFIISIVNSFAQSYHKRIHKKKNKVNKD